MTAREEKPEQVVSEDGTPIAVWRSGEGPPLVLVHGAAADHIRWAPALPALEERFTVLAIDRRGRGQSGDADEYAIEREYEDVAAVVESAGEAANVLGHSYGGICALEAALLTHGVRRLVLYEAPMGFLASPPHVVQRLETLLEEGKRDELVAFFMREVAGLPSDQIELLRSLPAWEARLAVAHTIPREERASREYAFDPDRFRQLLVVGHFLDHLPHRSPKLLFELAGGGFRVLDGVVQDCGNERVEVGDAADVGQQMRDADRMVDVGRGVHAFSALGPVLAGRELNSFQQDRRAHAAYEIITFRGYCELSSRNVFLLASSSVVGWTLPVTSVTRETSVCSPGVAPFHA